VAASDRKLRELARRFTKDTKIRVTVDHIANPQLPAKLAAEAQMQSGHNLIDLRMHLPIYHKHHLVDLTDVVMPLAEQNGGMYDFCAEAALVQGHWRAMPWHHCSFPGSSNKRDSDQVGEEAPDTWEGLLRAGGKLKANGYAIGIEISPTYDAISTLSAVMWCYGSKTVEADGKTVAINSTETEAAIEYVRRLYTDVMASEVLLWDANSNNRLLLSSKGSRIHNVHSHYLLAKEKQMAIADRFISVFHRKALPDDIRRQKYGRQDNITAPDFGCSPIDHAKRR
jgi:multiple sugar transport system substrate-binding protein